MFANERPSHYDLIMPYAKFAYGVTINQPTSLIGKRKKYKREIVYGHSIPAP